MFRIAAILALDTTPGTVDRPSTIRITPSKVVVVAAAVLAVAAMLWASSSSTPPNPEQTGARNGLQAFEMLGLFVAIFRLSQSEWCLYDPIDVAGLMLAVLVALSGHYALAVAVFACALYFHSRHDLPRQAAAALMMAISIQAVWAPLLFSRLSFLLLPLDAKAAGAALSLIVPGAGTDHTTIFMPNGFNVTVVAGCSSFHNISLASLCWVAVTLLQRPYWTRRDAFVGLATALVQVGFNVARLMVVSTSEPLFNYWHDGSGRHAFAIGATMAAILIAFFGASWAQDRQALRPISGSEQPA